jgi:hypothetical protein
MFRFTIRELVLLTLVVAMGVGWWMDRARANKLQEREQAALYFIARMGYEPGPTHLKSKRRVSPSPPVSPLP